MAPATLVALIDRSDILELPPSLGDGPCPGILTSSATPTVADPSPYSFINRISITRNNATDTMQQFMKTDTIVEKVALLLDT